jgi:hypothetical protein
MNRIRISIVLIAIFSSSLVPVANAQDIEKCRLAANDSETVSLGFPLRSERLANKPNPNILVLPYQLSDEPEYVFSVEQKNYFIEASKKIEELSFNNTSINLIFGKTVKLDLGTKDLDKLTRVRPNQRTEFEKSTAGFVEMVLKKADPFTDFTKIDAVIVFTNSLGYAEIGEAFMFTKDPGPQGNFKRLDGDGWLSPIRTSEGEISNAILIYNRLGTYLVTHELLHLYGLTDLYGSVKSPKLSLMSNRGDLILLPFEQWILGWLPNSSVTCVDIKSEISQNLSKNKFEFFHSKGNQSLILPTGPFTATVIDFTQVNSARYILFYDVDNNLRPPITEYWWTPDTPLRVDNFQGTSTVIESPRFRLLVSNNTEASIEFHIIPAGTTASEEFDQLITQSIANKAIGEKLGQVKEGAEAKEAVEPNAQQNQITKVTAAKKKSSIICTKGKISKKFTGINPRCPAGYKKK